MDFWEELQDMRKKSHCLRLDSSWSFLAFLPGYKITTNFSDYTATRGGFISEDFAIASILDSPKDSE